VVVCGIDGESTFGMIRREALPKPAEQALEEALANLADEDVTYEKHAFGGRQLAVVSGSFYAAEKLLDPAFLQRRHRELSAPVLLAAAPARGELLLAPDDGDPALLARFRSEERRVGKE